MDSIEKEIGYSFKNRKLLKTALTHPSYDNHDNYERLEFLGDAVLELAVSRVLFDKYPDKNEGELTKYRANAVCSISLADVARELSLGDYLLLGKCEETSGGRNKNSILENTVEAIIGAIYLDSSFDETFEVIKRFFDGRFSVKREDSKSALQERVQKQGANTIRYEVASAEGPPHARVFHSRVYIGEKLFGEGEGRNKKESEQRAAAAALELYKK